MQVYLIPIGGDEYEPYFEPPDEPDDEPVEGRSWFGRLRHRLNTMLREAEAERHRRHESGVRPPAGLMARARRKVMRWIVERAAEQRLLWHLRTATDGHPRRTRRPIGRAGARGDEAWAEARCAIDTCSGSSSMASACSSRWRSILVPGPNVIGYLLHLHRRRPPAVVARRAERPRRVPWTIAPSPLLTELRHAAAARTGGACASRRTTSPTGSDCSTWRRSSSGWPVRLRDRLRT